MCVMSLLPRAHVAGENRSANPCDESAAGPLIISHHGRACTLRRTRRHAADPAAPPDSVERCRGAWRSFLMRLRIANAAQFVSHCGAERHAQH